MINENMKDVISTGGWGGIGGGSGSWLAILVVNKIA